MAKPKKPKPSPIKVKLSTPMDFDQAMKRIVRVKPPQDSKPKDVN